MSLIKPKSNVDIIKEHPFPGLDIHIWHLNHLFGLLLTL